jgi:hypothetical protein
MKIRQGFVSNSSSASFIIDKTRLNGLQIIAITNHIPTAIQMGMEYVDEGDAWDITDNHDGTMTLSTIIDNFNMDEFLEKIGATHAVISRDD